MDRESRVLMPNINNFTASIMNYKNVCRDAEGTAAPVGSYWVTDLPDFLGSRPLVLCAIKGAGGKNQWVVEKTGEK